MYPSKIYLVICYFWGQLIDQLQLTSNCINQLLKVTYPEKCAYPWTT